MSEGSSEYYVRFQLQFGDDQWESVTAEKTIYYRVRR